MNHSSVGQATKRHLTQRIGNLDDKMEKQNEMSKLIKNDVCAEVFLYLLSFISITKIIVKVIYFSVLLAF